MADKSLSLRRSAPRQCSQCYWALIFGRLRLVNLPKVNEFVTDGAKLVAWCLFFEIVASFVAGSATGFTDLEWVPS